MRDEQELRQAIITEAKSWLRTPYHHLGWIKGQQGGVDCARFPICVYAAVGLIESFDPGYFPEDYMLHRGEEHYLRFVEQHARPIDAPLPGDMAIVKVGRVYWHGAIVIDWPLCVHARYMMSVELADFLADQGLAKREKLFYSLFAPRDV